MSYVSIRCEVCGTTFSATRSSRRTCSDTCRKRLQRGAGTQTVDMPTTEPGQTLVDALEAWLASPALDGLPGPLVTQARMLAHGLDAQPGDASLHARYTACMRELMAAAARPPEVDVAAEINALFNGPTEP